LPVATFLSLEIYFRSAIDIHRRSWRFWCLLEGDRLLINVSRRSFDFKLFPLCVHMNILVSKATLTVLIPPIIAPPPLTSIATIMLLLRYSGSFLGPFICSLPACAKPKDTHVCLGISLRDSVPLKPFGQIPNHQF
jgi:hypothetical protein